jgi:thioredoxin reductase (NADPH)
VPFAIPEPKPTRRQAIAYYHSVVRTFDVPLALHEEVLAVDRGEDGFIVTTRRRGETLSHYGGAVALATGYFADPRHLGVTGEELDWVHDRYLEPFAHYGEEVVVVGGGNSACETAMELWRAGAQVTLVHRGAELKRGVKYWLKPDVENRIAEGAFQAMFETNVESFGDHGVEVIQNGQTMNLGADAVYVLIGYDIDISLQRGAGVEINPETLVPKFDPETCESNVPGLYIAGTLQAGRDTNRIFIENSRVHGRQIIRHLARGRHKAGL